MTERRWRMQSLKTGWGVEAEYTKEGRKSLIRMRRAEKEKFKYARIYACAQLYPEVNKIMVPFNLTHRQFK